MDIVFICIAISMSGLLLVSVKNSMDINQNYDLLFNLQKQIDIVWERFNLQDEYITKNEDNLQDQIKVLAKWIDENNRG